MALVLSKTDVAEIEVPLVLYRVLSANPISLRISHVAVSCRRRFPSACNLKYQHVYLLIVLLTLFWKHIQSNPLCPLIPSIWQLACQLLIVPLSTTFKPVNIFRSDNWKRNACFLLALSAARSNYFATVKHHCMLVLVHRIFTITNLPWPSMSPLVTLYNSFLQQVPAKS